MAVVSFARYCGKMYSCHLFFLTVDCVILMTQFADPLVVTCGILLGFLNCCCYFFKTRFVNGCYRSMTKRLGVETISGWWDQTGAYGKPGNGTGNGNGTLIRQIHECFKLRSMIDINPTSFFAFIAHKMGDDKRGGSKILVAGH